MLVGTCSSALSSCYTQDVASRALSGLLILIFLEIPFCTKMQKKTSAVETIPPLRFMKQLILNSFMAVVPVPGDNFLVITTFTV